MMEPEAMFDIHYFLQDPRPFYAFAKVNAILDIYFCTGGAA